MRGFFDDVATIITHPADDVNAIVNVRLDDMIDAMQGAPIVGGLAPDVRAFVHGPLRDFAKTELGAMVLTGVSVGLIAALPFVGPQLSFFAYATPGFISGGSFGPAWVAGYAQFLRKGVKFLTQNSVDLGLPDIDLPPEVEQQISDYTQKLQDGVKAGIDFLHSLAPGVLANMTYDELAKDLGIRFDSAVWALANARGNMEELAAAAAMNFDPTTGNLITAAQAHLLANAHASMSVGGSMQTARLYTAPAERPKATVQGSSYLAGRYVDPVPPPDPGTKDAAIAATAIAAKPPEESAAPVIIGGLALAAAAALAWWLKWPPQIFGRR